MCSRKQKRIFQTLVLLTVVFGFIYGAMLYYELQSQLRKAEATALKYQQHQESLSAQLQGTAACLRPRIPLLRVSLSSPSFAPEELPSLLSLPALGLPCFGETPQLQRGQTAMIQNRRGWRRPLGIVSPIPC